jgi:hypothetical protein
MKAIFTSSNMLLAWGVLMVALAISISAAQLKATHDAVARERNAAAAAGQIAAGEAWDLTKPCWSTSQRCADGSAPDQAARFSRKK